MTDQKYKNEDEGAIWGNHKKERETQPDFTGSATVDGKEYYVSAWKRGENASDRAPVLKFKFNPKDQPKDSAQYSNDAKPAPAVDVNSDIPF